MQNGEASAVFECPQQGSPSHFHPVLPGSILTPPRCYLDGATSSSSQPLKLLLQTPGRFYDRDCFQKDADKQLVPVRAFVGDPRTLLFEYDLQSKAIIADGLWGQERDYAKHTPMTTWDISIVGYEGVDAGQQIDFSGLKGLIMEFTCDVCWTGW